MFEILDLSCKTMGVLECLDKKSNLENEKNTQLEYKDLYYGTQSDILKLEDEQEQDLKSINFGLAMHYMLEKLEGFDLIFVEHAKTMMINKYGHILEDEEIEDIQNRVEMLINSEEFRNLLSDTYYKEKALRYKNNLRYLDLLVKDNTGWRVIDYKSSMNFKQNHINQVSYYMDALKEITEDMVCGYICYLLSDGIKILKVDGR